MTDRLDKLVSLVPKCNVVADIGCDHGYAGIELLKTGKAVRVIFVDVSQPSLDKARNNCPEEFGCRAEFVCRDGLGDIQVDCALIAGMGGLEIISILSNATFPPPYLVLQPNRNPKEVRMYLCKEYGIDYDGKIFDGKFYDMIVANRTRHGENLSEMEIEFGKTNMHSPTNDFCAYLISEQTKLKKILLSCDDLRVRQRLSLVEQAIATVGGIK